MSDRRASAAGPRPPRYGRYVGLLALLVLAVITVNTIVTKPNGVSGVEPGRAMPPFAVPLATGGLRGDANIATHAYEGSAGRVPACSVRGPQVLNVCELYERGPVVLALFIQGGSCADVLGDMQALMPAYPGVSFAAVAIKPDRSALRRLISKLRLTLPIGVDADGALVALYKDASCPQLTFALPGGVVQGRPLLSRPPLPALRARVQALVAAARAQGWKAPA